MNTPEPSSQADAVDLTNCEREAIHHLGQVQNFGCLIGVSIEWLITHASANTEAVLGLNSDDLIGSPFVESFGPEVLHDMRGRLHILQNERDGSVRLFGYDLFRDDRRYDISIHVVERTLVLEFEIKSGHRDRDDAAVAHSLINRVRSKETLEDMCQTAARGLKTFCDFDRVMVYRFEPDGTGSVIAEAKSSGSEAFLGLRYPASDIPAQARELYKRNPLRIIADVDGETHKIHPERDTAGRPFDLSMAVTRAVSPIHLEYLRNMGVKASLSVSIVRKGELWGLFACHNETPVKLDFERRSAIELFGLLFAYELAQMEYDTELADIERARSLHDELITMASGGDLAETFAVMADQIADVIACDGIAFFANGTYTCRGEGLSEEEFRELSRFLNAAPKSSVFHTDRLSSLFPRARDYEDRVSGVLVLPISRSPRDYIVLSRREVAQTVTWAGNPEKPVNVGENGMRLSPRKSFEAWRQTVRGHSVPWMANEVRAAEALRVTLLEVVLKLSDEASAANIRAHEQQELLIAELNHRVRNILNLIRGLISQGRNKAVTLEHYSADLDARIHALARAHDQLTQKNWGWVALRTLIANETQAFLGPETSRVEISGDEVELSPAALTTMALVLHEMVTNSAKHGALSDSSGTVHIEQSILVDGALRLKWEERGGPPVAAPTRVGFGTKIIEKSIPYELKGRATTRYLTAGLEAEFIVPALHVREPTESIDGSVMVQENATIENLTLVGHALVVEDNMIIAMDAADTLTDLGAHAVHTAGNVAEAMAILDAQKITFALIDVNLGCEISLPIAQHCAKFGIPIVLATGYGTSADIVEVYPQSPILQKPYTTGQLHDAISEVFGVGTH